MRENKIASQDSSLIVQAFTPWKPCITLASQMTSDTPTRLDPWPSDHCLLGTTLSCRAWDSAGSAELQGQRLFNRLEMAACLKTPPTPSTSSSSRLVYTPLFGEEGVGPLSGTCPGEHPLQALRQTDKQTLHDTWLSFRDDNDCQCFVILLHFLRWISISFRIISCQIYIH